MRTIRLFAMLRDVVGDKEIAVPFEDGGTVRELIRAIHDVNPDLAAKIIDESGQLTGFVNIFVDGRNILFVEGLDTRIAPGVGVNLFPPVAGG